jgi:hypothetical protein
MPPLGLRADQEALAAPQLSLDFCITMAAAVVVGSIVLHLQMLPVALVD